MTREVDFVDLYEFLLNHDVEEPIMVLKHGRPCAALIPPVIFEALGGNARRSIAAKDLGPEDLKTILSVELPAGAGPAEGAVKK